MRELLQLRDQGLLNADQSYWFRETKEAEELYRRASDPYSLHDLLAGNASLNASESAELAAMRAAMDAWLAETGDLSQV